MGRPALAVGTHGKITITPDGDGHRARTQFRDYDGERREVARWGRTRTAAEAAIKLALRDRSAPTGDAITQEMTVKKLSGLWLETVGDADASVGTRRTYDFAASHYVLPGLGALRLRELTVQTIDKALIKVRDNHGPGAAKSARSVLSGMLGYAVRNGALPTNLARDTSPISTKATKEIRALTVEECVDILVGMRGSDRYVALDLPDLVDWMLGTGMRIGEACAVRAAVLSRGTVEVNATVIREPKVGLFIQERPKTAAGHRVLTVTPHLAGVLERRKTEPRLRGPHGVVFCSPRGKLRDPSNTSGDLREALDELGYPWVTSHVFRKTVATRLDEADFSPREIADVLGHEKPSMTLDVYMGRKVVSAAMASVLDRS